MALPSHQRNTRSDLPSLFTVTLSLLPPIDKAIPEAQAPGLMNWKSPPTNRYVAP